MSASHQEPPPDSGLTLDFIGTGDAFGSGGRLNTCFQIRTEGRRVLVDCGASALIGLKRSGFDPGLVDTIIVSHFHGDHYGGIPFLLRERQLEGPRDQPLTVLGPEGTHARLMAASEAMFPGSTHYWKSAVDIIELTADRSYNDDRLAVLLLPVVHTSGTNPHGIRAEVDGYVISYSGDTEWTPSLNPLSAAADVFICECYSIRPKRNHMDYLTLSRRADGLNCGRLLLTHLGPDVLDTLEELELPAAVEGSSLILPLRHSDNRDPAGRPQRESIDGGG